MNMNEKPTISIITRAYNVEAYIRECADSVLGQSFTDFEWIVLENGSTDETGNILKKYADRDCRIRLYINTKNYNKIEPCEEYYSYVDLLRETRGKYLTDLDSDDLLQEDFLKTLYENAIKYDAEIVAAGSIQFTDNNINHIKQTIYPKAFIHKEISRMGENIQNFYDAFRPVWGKLIARRLYLDNLEYLFQRPSYLSYGGDTYTMLRLLQLANSCVCIEEPLYFYRIRQDSTSRRDYYEERCRSYDAIFYAGYHLLEKWKKSHLNNLLLLCSIHRGSLYSDIKVICQHQNMSINRKAEFIHKTFKNELYRNYISDLPADIIREWDNEDFHLIFQLLGHCQAGETALFYRYHFGRRFMARRLIALNEMDRFDVMGYIAASVTPWNTNRYEDELLNSCVYYISGKPCHSFAEAEHFAEKYRTTDENELAKKQKMAEYLELQNYGKLWDILNEFDSSMEWDCDVLYAKALCYLNLGQNEIATKILAVAYDLYPAESLIQQGLETLTDLKSS